MQRYSVLGYYKDVLVGSASCRYEDKEEGRVVYIMTISVLKPYRRYGIGSQLLDKAIQDCKKGEIKKIYLHVLQSNESAIEFYSKWGFTLKDTLVDYYKDLDPEHRNCYIFEKDLTDYKPSLI